MHSTPYPDQFLRGIPNNDFIDGDGYPTSVLFYFLDRQTEEAREDGFLEQSISWRDDDGAEDTLLKQTKENRELQFKAGAAVLLRRELDRIVRMPSVNKQLAYERKQIEGNKYHGNLLLKRDVEKRVMKRIAATIATVCVSSIISNRYI